MNRCPCGMLLQLVASPCCVSHVTVLNWCALVVTPLLFRLWFCWEGSRLTISATRRLCLPGLVSFTSTLLGIPPYLTCFVVSVRGSYVVLNFEQFPAVLFFFLTGCSLFSVFFTVVRFSHAPFQSSTSLFYSLCLSKAYPRIIFFFLFSLVRTSFSC